MHLMLVCVPMYMQCIAAGSHIANHELESAELRPYAIQVSKMVTKVRQALREECFTNKTRVYPQKVMPLKLWYNIIMVECNYSLLPPHGPLSSLAYPMINHPHPSDLVAGNLPIETLVTR